MNLQDQQFPLDNVLARVVRSIRAGRTYLIGVDGGAGAGKSTFAGWLARELGAGSVPVKVVHLDDFVRPSSEREHRNAVLADLDWLRVKDQVLQPLRAGKVAAYQRYDWVEDRLGMWKTILPGGIVIIDGVTATRHEFAAFYDLRIWLSCPRATRTARLLGRGDTPQAEIDRWLPAETAYLRSRESNPNAHHVLDTGGNQLSA